MNDHFVVHTYVVAAVAAVARGCVGTVAGAEAGVARAFARGVVALSHLGSAALLAVSATFSILHHLHVEVASGRSAGGVAKSVVVVVMDGGVSTHRIV